MIFKNEVIEYQGGRHRLLDSDPMQRKAWLISLDEPLAMPICVPLEHVSALAPVRQSDIESKTFIHKATELTKRDKALEILAPLLLHGRKLFEDHSRFALIKAHAATGVASAPTLYKLLRAWWKNGQCPDALIPRYRSCGRRGSVLTSGRGPRRSNGETPFQLTEEDIKKFEDVIHTVYLSDARSTITNAYQRMLERHYSYSDGNGTLYIKQTDQRPSLRQLQHYLKNTYSNEHRLRMRLGDKDYDLNHRGVVGTVGEDCLGVGHIYECDATIADVMLCASDDKLSFIGKPTVYIIIDRESRLIVGLYNGLENPSWVCAKEAILFISQDKEAICARYGVEYDPADWPAHCVFPQSILADLGEWNSKGGEQLATRLATRVSFVPSRRADWKPCVETTFKQTRAVLQDGVPGMDPPDNANKRQKKNYLSEASLTLHAFTKLMLEFVIKHNRGIVKSYAMTSADLRDGFRPTPIALWNKGIAERSGALTRYPLEYVQFQLLARDVATVTEHGVLFRDCYYTSEKLMRRGWFGTARAGRFKVDVAFDHRLVDNIYVMDAEKGQEPCICTLTSRSAQHMGKSFGEVYIYFKRLKAISHELDAHSRQVDAEFHHRTNAVIETSKVTLKSRPKATRSERRSDTKDARAAERSQERSLTGRITHEAPKAAPTTKENILDFGTAKERRLAVPDTTKPGTLSATPKPTGISLEELARNARNRLLGGL